MRTRAGAARGVPSHNPDPEAWGVVTPGDTHVRRSHPTPHDHLLGSLGTHRNVACETVIVLAQFSGASGGVLTRWRGLRAPDQLMSKRQVGQDSQVRCPSPLAPVHVMYEQEPSCPNPARRCRARIEPASIYPQELPPKRTRMTDAVMANGAEPVHEIDEDLHSRQVRP